MHMMSLCMCVNVCGGTQPRCVNARRRPFPFRILQERRDTLSIHISSQFLLALTRISFLFLSNGSAPLLIVAPCQLKTLRDSSVAF